jgi:hypothetical protein
MSLAPKHPEKVLVVRNEILHGQPDGYALTRFSMSTMRGLSETAPCILSKLTDAERRTGTKAAPFPLTWQS